MKLQARSPRIAYSLILTFSLSSTCFLLCQNVNGLVKVNKPYRIFGVNEIIGDRSNIHVTGRQKFVKKSNPINSDEVPLQPVMESLKPSHIIPTQSPWPIVINTWGFSEAAKTAWDVLSKGGSVLDAVEQGCSKCEELQCDSTVGYGGSPDENGETTLDAMIMDGDSHAVGAVGCLRNVKNAISVARKVMEHTGHTLLVGELATNFAVKMGFPLENLTTDVSAKMHMDWKQNKCQPNFWRNVQPDPTNSCGPYRPIPVKPEQLGTGSRPKVDRFNHDTISMVVIDYNGRIASGTSSNGARNKIPGRVGDAPITGAGSYVDKHIGGAAATGDGDIMARFLPSLVAVEEMRRGAKPESAARYAISKIAAYYPNFSGALVAVNLEGEVGAACHNIPNGFPYSFRTPLDSDVKVDIVHCQTE